MKIPKSFPILIAVIFIPGCSGGAETDAPAKPKGMIELEEASSRVFVKTSTWYDGVYSGYDEHRKGNVAFVLSPWRQVTKDGEYSSGIRFRATIVPQDKFSYDTSRSEVVNAVTNRYEYNGDLFYPWAGLDDFGLTHEEAKRFAELLEAYADLDGTAKVDSAITRHWLRLHFDTFTISSFKLEVVEGRYHAITSDDIRDMAAGLREAMVVLDRLVSASPSYDL